MHRTDNLTFKEGWELKKYLAIIVSMLFVLGLAATAFAADTGVASETQPVVAKGDTQITLGGSLRFRGEFSSNISDQLEGGSDDHSSKYDARVRLNVDAKVADNVAGYVEVEAGNGPTADTWTWGESADGATGAYNVGNAKRGEFNVLQAWILYKATDTVGLKIGHMPLALGNKLFFNHTKFGDDAIVVFADPSDDLHVGALAIKFSEGNAGNNDDANAYVALLNYKGSGFNASADLTYVDDQTFMTTGSNVLNIGLRGDTEVAGVKVKADLELQSGTLAEGSTAELDVKGMAFLIGADYKLNDTTLGLEIGYGSGDDDATDDEFGTFITSLSSGVPYPGFIYGPRVKTAAGATNTGIANTTYVKASVTHPVTSDLTAKADLLWLSASEDVALNGGTADSDLGIEIDGKVTYKLARNLNYWVEGGYLIVGDAYNNAAGNADDAYAIRHGIQLSF